MQPQRGDQTIAQGKCRDATAARRAALGYGKDRCQFRPEGAAGFRATRNAPDVGIRSPFQGCMDFFSSRDPGRRCACPGLSSGRTFSAAKSDRSQFVTGSTAVYGRSPFRPEAVGEATLDLGVNAVHQDRAPLGWPPSRGIAIAAALAMLLPGIYCQLVGQIYRNGESYYYGWPFLHPDNEYRFVSNAFWLDLICVVLVAAATGYVAQALDRTVANRGQFKLTSLLLWMAIVPPLLGLFVNRDQNRRHPWAADFIDQRVIFDPVAIQYPPWVSLSILFGLVCLVYATIMVAWHGCAAAHQIWRRSPDWPAHAAATRRPDESPGQTEGRDSGPECRPGLRGRHI
jgi:hypothetical protein